MNSAAAPNVDGPIRESQPTMAPRHGAAATQDARRGRASKPDDTSPR